MNKFETADCLIKKYSEQLLNRIDCVAKGLPNDDISHSTFINYLYMIFSEFDGFCRSLDSLNYISYYNRLEYLTAFKFLLEEKSQKIHKERNWIYFRVFGK